MAELTVKVSTWALVAAGAVLLAAEAFADLQIPRVLLFAPFALIIVEALAGIGVLAGTGVVGLVALWKRRGRLP